MPSVKLGARTMKTGRVKLVCFLEEHQLMYISSLNLSMCI
jgi:hypothetical protein